MTHIKESRTAQIHVVCTDDALTRPVCGKLCPRYDRCHREWRPLNICAYRTMVVADLPQVQCPEHGVKTISVPWTASKVRFTKLNFVTGSEVKGRTSPVPVLGSVFGVLWQIREETAAPVPVA